MLNMVALALMETCSPRRVFLATRAVQGRKSRALVSTLPTEILSMIFSTMSNQDLDNMMLVCKRWREVGEPLRSCRAVQARRIRGLVSALPTEILRMIFSKISNKDLGNVMLVCKRWIEVGETLWSWPLEHNLSVGRRDLNMLGINRVQCVEEITVEKDDWEQEELEELVKSVGRLDKVWNIDMPGINLSSLDPEALAEMVTNKKGELTHVDMSHCKFTDHQLNEIFRTIDERFDFHLMITGVNLSNVNQDILAVGVNRLAAADMVQTKLTMQQVTNILTQAGRQTKLVEIFLDSNTIEGDPFLNSGISLSGACSTTQLVNKEVLRQARQNIGDLVLKYDFDDTNWTSYRASGRIVAYVANQSIDQ